MRGSDIRLMEILTKDLATGLPLFSSHRIILLSVASMSRLRKDLIRSIGRERMAILFSRFAYETGLASASAVGELYDFDSPEEWLRAGAVLCREAGLADVEFSHIEMDFETKRLTFRGTFKHSFESWIWRQESEPVADPVCWSMTGIISGFASGVMGAEVLVRETTCAVAGGDTCEFEGRTVAEWGLNLEDVRRYFAIDDVNEELARLRAAIQLARDDMARQNAEIRLLRQQHQRPEASDQGIIFRSESMAQVLMLAEKVAPTSSTVLIQGESGTGKEVLARFVHDKSGRRNHPFLAINCAALPPNLLESELFGHVKGAFTGADHDKKGLFVEAGEGTLFLDEVGELPLELQSKLLRAIQEKEVRPVGGVKDVSVKARIVTATNRDLRSMVAEGSFREDLFYRLAVFPLLVTPLRQRRQDILPLARHFLQKFRESHQGFSPEAVRKMEAYSWPGNVRELENWVEYAVVLAGDERITPDHLPLSSMQAAHDPLSAVALDLPTCDELERRYIAQVLEHTGGNKTEAARILGMSISTLWRRLKE